ncbi:unnamed protein product [Prunus armeniaca]
MATNSSASVSLKLLIDTKSHKVLFAEASKEAPLNGWYGGNCISDDPRAICPQCKYTLSTEVPYVAAQAITEGSSGGGGGYVKDVVTYMIMDNLEVKPMSTISCIAMLNRFNVKEVGTLEERMVLLGMDDVCIPKLLSTF